MDNAITLLVLVVIATVMGWAFWERRKRMNLERLLRTERLSSRAIAVLHYQKQVKKLSDEELSTYIDDHLDTIRKAVEHLGGDKVAGEG